VEEAHPLEQQVTEGPAVEVMEVKLEPQRRPRRARAAVAVAVGVPAAHLMVGLEQAASSLFDISSNASLESH